jgi:galactokinase
VLCDSQVKRELGNSEYNLRRSQCEKGVEILKKFYPDIHSLRDVSIQQLLSHQDSFDDVIFKRCKYVIEENQRVLEACQDLNAGNFEDFGQRMYQSHSGLMTEYEVSCEELDFLVETASKLPGIIGARMMGAGFGGCTINLVWSDQLERFEHAMSETFKRKMNKDAIIYVTEISTGAAIYKERIMNL